MCDPEIDADEVTDPGMRPRTRASTDERLELFQGCETVVRLDPLVQVQAEIARLGKRSTLFFERIGIVPGGGPRYLVEAPELVASRVLASDVSKVTRLAGGCDDDKASASLDEGGADRLVELLCSQVRSGSGCS